MRPTLAGRAAAGVSLSYKMGKIRLKARQRPGPRIVALDSAGPARPEWNPGRAGPVPSGLVPHAVPFEVAPLLGTTTLQGLLVVYGILLVVGGLIGFLKARSRPSLVAGSASGALALLTAALMLREPRAIWLGVVLALAMLVVFAIRFGRTRKMMPAGMLGLLSAVVLACLLAGVAG